MLERSLICLGVLAVWLAAASSALATGIGVQLADPTSIAFEYAVYAVPEPTPLLLLGAGLVGLVIAGRRRRQG